MKWQCRVAACPKLETPGGSCYSGPAPRKSRAELYLCRRGACRQLCVLTAAGVSRYTVTRDSVAVRGRPDRGMVSLSVATPPHTLLIDADPDVIRSFCKTLVLFLSSEEPTSSFCREPPTRLSAAKEKVTAKSMSHDPLSSISKTTKSVSMIDAKLRRMDRRLCSFEYLQTLNLSKNSLTELPKGLGDMPSLSELILAENQLGSENNDWEFMYGTQISKKLKNLDLSSNSITEWPSAFSQLKQLVSLNLNSNKISFLPSCVRRLESLRYFKISKNQLDVLPASLKNLTLFEIDISSNPMKELTNIEFNPPKVRSLLELTSVVVLQWKIYYHMGIVPFSLVKYLDSYAYCICGKASQSKGFKLFKQNFAPSITRHTIIRDELQSSKFALYCNFCSTKCYFVHTRRF